MYLFYLCASIAVAHFSRLVPEIECLYIFFIHDMPFLSKNRKVVFAILTVKGC